MTRRTPIWVVWLLCAAPATAQSVSDVPNAAVEPIAAAEVTDSDARQIPMSTPRSAAETKSDAPSPKTPLSSASGDDFKPSKQISEDFSISLHADI